MDSNHRSPARKSRFLLRKANCGDRTGAAKRVVSYAVPRVRIPVPPAASQANSQSLDAFVAEKWPNRGPKCSVNSFRELADAALVAETCDLRASLQDRQLADPAIYCAFFREALTAVKHPVERSNASFLSDARIPTTKPRFAIGARAVIRGFVTIIDRRTVSGASYPPKRPLGTPNLTGCSRPLPSRSIAEIKAVPRTKPLRLHQPGYRHKANLRPSAITRSKGLRRFPKEQQISFARRSGRE
jgi:hypothetical protein